MKRSALIAMIVLGAVAAGCATTPYNPFHVSRDEIFRRVKTVAVATVRVSADLSDADQTRAEFQNMIADELKAEGFQVVPATEYDQIFKRLRDEISGFFDPKTGKADEEKIKKVHDLCRRELTAKFQTDAILYPAIVVVSANFYEQTASWNGVTETATAGNWLQRMFSGGYTGKIPALSLWVWLKDMNGEVLYANGGGLQLISKMSVKGFVDVPVQELLVDPKIKSRSVEIAFAPLRGEEPKKHSSPELK